MLELLGERDRARRPLRAALIGAGTFGTMFLSQARGLAGLEIVGVADVSGERARAAIAQAGLSPNRIGAFDDPFALIALDSLDVVVEATGAPAPSVEHALEAIRLGRHVVMATVEGDVLAGPALAARARSQGVVYSLAYGDQPALVCELVDWARAAGFEVVCAGKGTKFLPVYRQATPDTVWESYGFTPEQLAAGGYNARMFTSFLDGTKSAIEMAAVCNATDLEPQPGGLGFPPAGSDRLATVCIPRQDGGALERSGTVEVVSSLERDGSPVENDLRFGVFVTFSAPSPLAKEWFGAYGLRTDPSGRYAALYRPYHLIGLETTVSVLAAGLLGEATGAPERFHADAIAVPKRALEAGEELDGEGGWTVYGALVAADEAVRAGLLPVGLARGARLVRRVAAGTAIRLADVEALPESSALELRRELVEGYEATAGRVESGS
jgi:predicted homoserine dehydrogenase-like protein